jgi:hypothetical protein
LVAPLLGHGAQQPRRQRRDFDVLQFPTDLLADERRQARSVDRGKGRRQFAQDEIRKHGAVGWFGKPVSDLRDDTLPHDAERLGARILHQRGDLEHIGDYGFHRLVREFPLAGHHLLRVAARLIAPQCFRHVGQRRHSKLVLPKGDGTDTVGGDQPYSGQCRQAVQVKVDNS